MGFFFAEVKKTEKAKPARRGTTKRGDIPIQSLNQLGCSVCPRKQDWEKLEHPQLEPTGSTRPLVYLMGTGPNIDEDDTGKHWTGKAGEVILSKFSRNFRRDALRYGHMTQCMPPALPSGERDLTVDVVEIECCRSRVVEDIERMKPKVVIGVGDQPLFWATGLSGSALRWRGQLIATKIGSHVCWFFPILWPNFAFKEKQYGKSEYEMALEHDIAYIEAMVDNDWLPDVEHYAGPYDKGIELITGQEPGDFQRLEQALEEMKSWPDTSIDLETNGLRPYIKNPHIWTVAIGNFDRTVAFALDHPEGWGTEDRRRKVWALLGDFLLNSNLKLAHNLTMEQEWLAFFFGDYILRRTEWGDTMAMCHTLDEREGTKSLDAQCRIRFGFNLKAQSRVDVSRPDWINLYPIKEVLRYNGLDTKWTHRLAHYLEPIIKADDESQWREYLRKVELCPTLVMTELKGLPADQEYAGKLDATLLKQLTGLEEQIRRTPEVRKYAAQFGAFSPTNSNHVLKLLRDVCKRGEVSRADRDGSVSESSDEAVLSSLPKNEVPSASLILEHRGVEKQRSTYLSPVISGKVISHDGRIHSKYSAMIAETGRLAASDPNIQNWPKRKHKEVRGIVYAPNGQWIVAADYGQIEFRVVGMASEDPNLVKYCWTGYDVHGFWAQRMVDEYPEIKDYIVEEFEVDWDEKGLKTLRQEAKNGWVFPQLFGSSLRSCAAQLHLPEDIAERLGAEFWDDFREAKKWQERLLKSYEKNLYVETLGGRRRRGAMTKNQIINHPIQGTAADIVLEGMNALSMRASLEEDPELQPSLNVHDDLSTLIADARVERKIDIIVREMCLPRFDYINVPLVVEVSVGQRWHELEEIAKYRSDELFGHRNPYK